MVQKMITRVLGRCPRLFHFRAFGPQTVLNDRSLKQTSNCSSNQGRRHKAAWVFMWYPSLNKFPRFWKEFASSIS